MIYNLTVDDGLMAMAVILMFLSSVYIISEVYQYNNRKLEGN